MFELFPKVFSVVNGITTMDLTEEGGNWDESIAQQMVKLGHAVRVEESYMSKTDNEQRQIAQESQSKPNSFASKYRQRELVYLIHNSIII